MLPKSLEALVLTLALTLCALPPAEAAEACRRVDHEGRGFTVCEAGPGDDLRLFLYGPDDRPLGSFEQVARRLREKGQALVFAMNAGMYHRDRSPVGLYVEEGRELAPIVTAAGPGNFGLRPNGVFCIRHDGGYAVIESRVFARSRPECRFATQSGPMLVIDGALHPRFLPDATSRYVRNGVGVTADGTRALFAISDRPVTFHEFGRLFRDVLETPQALYFDGNISRLHAPAMGRSDIGLTMGPIVGLVAPAPEG